MGGAGHNHTRARGQPTEPRQRLIKKSLGRRELGQLRRDALKWMGRNNCPINHLPILEKLIGGSTTQMIVDFSSACLIFF